MPSAQELAHDFLWRCVRVLPARGQIGIFNRSYYEEVLVTRVHPELLAAERLPHRDEPEARLWQHRFEDINAFERHLDRSGTRVVKVFLHLSSDEQRKRLLARVDDPAKRWKFSAADLAERAHFEEYMVAYEEAISATSSATAPWFVIPADDKPILRALVGGLLVEAISGLDLSLPEPSPDQQALLREARRALLAE